MDPDDPKSEVKTNGDFESKTVTTDKKGKEAVVVETKTTDAEGVVTETKDTTNPNGSGTEQTIITQPNGDYKSVTATKNKKGEITETVTQTLVTNSKLENRTLTTETVNSKGTETTTKVVQNLGENGAGGAIKKATVTETNKAGQSSTVDLKTDKNGDVVVRNIDSTKSTVTIPDSVEDADGNAHEVKAITGKALSGESAVKTLVVGKNIEIFEKNALRGSGVKTLKLDKVPKFEKNSLYTGDKLTIVVHSKAQKKAVEKQLKRAGAPNAKVKVSKKK